MAYQVTYTDPDGVHRAVDRARSNGRATTSYQMYEFACHEGNEVRELITASRAQRKKDAEAAAAGRVASK